MAKSTSIKVDFSNVEVQDYSIPNGDYVLTVTGVEKKRSENSGADYLSWEYKVAEGPCKGRKVWDNTSLQPQALWRLRALLEAMGQEIEDGEMDIELDDFDGETVGVTIENEKYQGKDKPRIVSFLSEVEAPPTPAAASKKGKPSAPPPEEEEEGDEEEAPAPAAKTARKKSSKTALTYTVGQSVTFEDEGTTHTGKIISIEGETVTVKVKRDEWELDIAEISAA